MAGRACVRSRMASCQQWLPKACSRSIIYQWLRLPCIGKGNSPDERVEPRLGRYRLRRKHSYTYGILVSREVADRRGPVFSQGHRARVQRDPGQGPPSGRTSLRNHFEKARSSGAKTAGSGPGRIYTRPAGRNHRPVLGGANGTRSSRSQDAQSNTAPVHSIHKALTCPASSTRSFNRNRTATSRSYEEPRAAVAENLPPLA
ncbi:hypothetical protein DPMN_170544 [Dreissena polymorpha]|uniref:Uncharacterized protein n=1 Tax=Dreissena polymorpha TaxID=45954 RepID=A0A9D4IDA6_DREPO|nr:hypothetical protein DPMN_170544 [Dreissena polymorpha]